MAPRNGQTGGECEGHIIPSSSSPFAAFVERRFSGSGGGTLAEFIGRIKSLTAARQSRRLQSDPCLMPAPISMIPNIWRSMAPSLLPSYIHRYGHFSGTQVSHARQQEQNIGSMERISLHIVFALQETQFRMKSLMNLTSITSWMICRFSMKLNCLA